MASTTIFSVLVQLRFAAERQREIVGADRSHPGLPPKEYRPDCPGPDGSRSWQWPARCRCVLGIIRTGIEQCANGPKLRHPLGG